MSRGPTPIEVGKLISVPEAAKMAGVHRSTMLTRLVRLDKEHGGKLLTKSGRKYLVKRDVLMSILSDRDDRVVTRAELEDLYEAIRSLETGMNRRLNALGARLRALETSRD